MDNEGNDLRKEARANAFERGTKLAAIHDQADDRRHTEQQTGHAATNIPRCEVCLYIHQKLHYRTSRSAFYARAGGHVNGIAIGFERLFLVSHWKGAHGQRNSLPASNCHSPRSWSQKDLVEVP